MFLSLLNSKIIFAREYKKDKSPLNLNILRKIALSLLAKTKRGRLSKRKMMLKALMNPEVLLEILLAYSQK